MRGIPRRSSSTLRALVRCLPLTAFLVAVVGAPATLFAEPMIGCHAIDSLVRRYWRDPNSVWSEHDSIPLLHGNGFGWLRVGVTTQSHPELRQTDDWSTLPWQDGYWSCREVAERILAEGQRAGMGLYLFLFLSDAAAHGGRQIPPAGWEQADVLATCRLLEQYSRETVTYFRGQGLHIECYEVGNEIERGICGFRPDERVIRPAEVDQLKNIPWMRENIWVPEALMLTAAIRGIRQADPEAKIVLHISTRPSPEDRLVVAFFEAMVDAGVPFDYAGLSFYPWIGYPSSPPNEEWRADLNTWVEGIAELGKPVIICEYSYPHHPSTAEPGQITSPLPGYLCTPDGQASWIRDFLGWCGTNPSVAGSFYFYPDYAWRVEGPSIGAQGLFLLEDGRLDLTPGLIQIREAAGRSR